jgi:hypothetical protein
MFYPGKPPQRTRSHNNDRVRVEVYTPGDPDLASPARLTVLTKRPNRLNALPRNALALSTRQTTVDTVTPAFASSPSAKHPHRIGIDKPLIVRLSSKSTSHHHRHRNCPTRPSG